MVYDAVGNRVCYSLMNQYTPMPQLRQGDRTAEERNRASGTVRDVEDEYSELIAFALDLGITNSFMQEGGTATESFIPTFDLTGVL
jgi:putative pyruvate formate lyase activating enzyme